MQKNISLPAGDLMPRIIIMTRKENAKKKRKDTPKSSLREDLMTNLKAYVGGVAGSKSLLKHFQLEGKHSLNSHVDQTL